MKRQLRQALCINPQWIGRADCARCGVRKSMLFSELEEDTFEHLLRPIDNLRYPQKTVFYNQGDSGEMVYSIRRGLVKLVQYLPDGSERIVRLLGHGAITGLEALVNDPYEHSVVALKEVDVCRIPVATLAHLAIDHPLLTGKIMKHWEYHLQLADRWISELSSGSIRVRVIRLLRLLLELVGDEQGNLELLNYDDMASIIGTSRETFTRTVSQLKHEKIIRKLGSSHLYACDVKLMKKEVE